MRYNYFIKLLSICIAAIIFCFLSACSSQQADKNILNRQANKQPSWILNPPDGNGNIYGVGSAKVYTDIAQAKKQASERAIIDMTSKLKIKISSTTKQSYQEQKTKHSNNFRQELSQAISAEIVPIELLEVTQQKGWHDEQTNTLYVLVHIDRIKSAAMTQQNINTLSTDLISYQIAKKDSDTLTRLLQTLPALEVIEKQNNLIERYIMLAGKQPVVQSNVTAQLESSIENLLNELQVTLQPFDKNHVDLVFESRLTELLNNKGLKLSSQNSADLSINYSLTEEILKKSGTFYSIITARVQFKDKNNRVLLDKKHDSKGASTLKSKSRESAINKISKLINKDIALFFSNPHKA